MMRAFKVALPAICVLIAMRCHPKDEGWTDLHRDATGCVLVVFKADAAPGEIAKVVDSATTVQVAGERRREELLPGIGSIVKIDHGGLTAYEVCFERQADDEQKEWVRRHFERSPLVAEVRSKQRA